MRNKEKRNGGEGRGWGEGEAQQDEETNKTVSSLREERDFLKSKKKNFFWTLSCQELLAPSVFWDW